MLLIEVALLFALITTALTSPPADIRKINSGFFFSMPKTLLSGRNETVCLSLHYSQSTPVKVTIDLKLKEKHFFTIRILDSEHSCFDLNVPPCKELKEPKFVSVRLQVQINGVIYAAHNHDPVVIYPNEKITFVETDRGTYKSGDRVKIRVLALSEDLLPSKGYKIPLVRIRNPLDIAVAVWENITTEFGLAQFDHQLSRGSVEGKWRIEAGDETASFEVNKYVLPRFQVELHHPRTIYYDVESETFKVCAKYSYGAEVQGSAFIRISDSHHNIEPVRDLKKMVDGCAHFTFSSKELGLSLIKHKFTMLDPKIHLHVTATVTEYGTDKIEFKTSKVLVSLKAYSLKLESGNMFLPGIPFQGALQITNVNIPLEEEVIQICYNLAIKRSWNYLNNEQCSNFTVGKRTLIPFQVFPLKSNVIHLHIQARSLNHTNIGDSVLVVRLYSPSSSYIQLENTIEDPSCKAIQQYTVLYTTDNLEEAANITFYYMIKNRGQIHKLRRIIHSVRNGSHHYPKEAIGTKHKYVKASSVDKFILKFKLGEKVFSNYQLLVYYINDLGEIIAASKDVTIESCLNNQVTAKWSSKQASPGSDVALMIETSSDSLCSISSLDKATRFMDDIVPLNANSFLKPFLKERTVPESGRKSCIAPTKRNRDVSSVTEAVNFSDCTNNCLVVVSSLTEPFAEPAEDIWDLKRKKRHVYPFSEDYDAYDIFNKFGTTVLSNFKVVTKPCYTGPSMEPPNSPVQFLTDQYDVHNGEKIAPIRSFFPETWLWELVPVKGSAIITRSLPHTITDWMTNVMCVSETQGVGFSETTTISGFQPFFVDVLTPYSIKKGEILYLNVVLFNYLNYSLPIRITLGESKGLKLVDLMNRRTVSYCVSSNNTVSHVFELKGIEMGNNNVTILAELDSVYPGQCGPDVVVNKRDVVIKSLLVEPSGYPVKVTKSALLCASETQTSKSVTWDIKVPESFIPETANAKVVINGDLLGQAIENLDELLIMPTGCGEQIMASLAPNLYVLQYLNATNSLRPSMRQRITRNLKIGYQRILNYAHKDGSFSAFGYHDPSGSMFLTAFVVRTLQEAKSVIYVDQRVIDRAVSWILDHQLENGCFSTMYHVFQDMGGSSNENSTASLTSYVMISLLEANVEVPESTKTNAKYCIRGHYHLDKYTLGISSYALFKINWYSEADRMLKKLGQISNQKDDMTWWSNKDTNGSLATDIEITSYVLLALLHHKTEDNLAKAHSVVRWLSTQQGPRGGFKTTQDTAVALDALAKYSAFINSQQMDLEVGVEATEQKHHIKMKREDRLKAKKIVLQKNTENEVTITVTGEGCALVQVVSSYYIRQIPSNNAFKLDTEISAVSNIDECSIAKLSSCLEYHGPDSHANMAILEVGLPSGYQADRGSLYRLIEGKESKLKMFEEIGDKIVLYFTKLDQQQLCVTFNINENAIIQTRSNSTIKLYDYYKPEYGIVQFYRIKDKCKIKSDIIPEISETQNRTSEASKVRRSVSGLNPDFVDMDIDLQVPEGEEGTTPMRLAPNASWTFDHNSIETDARSIVINGSQQIETRAKRNSKSRMNPDFVDQDTEMAMPDGIEGNMHVYVKAPNNTANKRG